MKKVSTFFIKIIQQEIDNIALLTKLSRKQAKLAQKPWIMNHVMNLDFHQKKNKKCIKPISC